MPYAEKIEKDAIIERTNSEVVNISNNELLKDIAIRSVIKVLPTSVTKRRPFGLFILTCLMENAMGVKYRVPIMELAMNPENKLEYSASSLM